MRRLHPRSPTENAGDDQAIILPSQGGSLRRAEGKWNDKLGSDKAAYRITLHTQLAGLWSMVCSTAEAIVEKSCDGQECGKGRWCGDRVCYEWEEGVV
jgi:hypothetical protein